MMISAAFLPSRLVKSCLRSSLTIRAEQKTYTAWDDILRGLSWAAREEIRDRAVERILATAKEQKAEDGGDDVVEEEEVLLR